MALTPHPRQGSHTSRKFAKVTSLLESHDPFHSQSVIDHLSPIFNCGTYFEKSCQSILSIAWPQKVIIDNSSLPLQLWSHTIINWWFILSPQLGSPASRFSGVVVTSLSFNRWPSIWHHNSMCVYMQTHPGRTCNKDWSYTRVIQYEFVGAANEEVRDVQSRFIHLLKNFKSKKS